MTGAAFGTPLAMSAEPRAGRMDCRETPFESGGPFVADGRYGPNLLKSPDLFRSDIRANLDGGEPQPGVALEMTLNVVDVDHDCRPLAGKIVYLWQCNAAGDYSAYVQRRRIATASASFLRGMQITDASGLVHFRTVYPGQYPGRAPHLHVRVYDTGNFRNILKTTQLAFDDSVNRKVILESNDYRISRQNTLISNKKDFLFADASALQMVRLSGDAGSGFTGQAVLRVRAE